MRSTSAGRVEPARRADGEPAPISGSARCRNEKAENDLRVANRRLLDPITLEHGLLREVTDIAQRYADCRDRDKIPCRSVWSRRQATPQTNGVVAANGKPAGSTPRGRGPVAA